MVKSYLMKISLMYYHGIIVSKEYLLNTIAKNNKHGLIGPGIS